jgi:hypothetical protein
MRSNINITSAKGRYICSFKDAIIEMFKNLIYENKRKL